MPDLAAAPYLRVTVLGGRRPADLVLPTDHPLALLLPQILAVVGAPDGALGYELTTVEGRVLRPDAELATADLPDGCQLRLVAAAQAPPPPIVYDMVEVVDHAAPVGVWAPASRRWVLSLLAALICLGTAWIGVGAHQWQAPALWWATTAALVLVSLATAALAATEAAWAFGAASLLAAGSAVAADGWQRPWWWCLVLLLAVLVTGWCRRRLVPTAVTAGVGGLLAGLGYLLVRLLPDPALAPAVLAPTALFLIGALPRVALAAAGVFRLDAQVGAGQGMPRRDAHARVAEAHWALAGGLLAAALVLGAALYAVALARPGPWTVGLTALLVLAAALRARHFPLAVERGALWLAAMAGVGGLARAALQGYPRAEPLLVLGAAASVAVLLTAAHTRPSDLVAARLRKAAGTVETAAMVASIPVAVGVFGLYGDLLATFR